MIDHDTFRSVLGRFASGVTIVTARDAGGADDGMTVSAFASVSLEPALVLVSIDQAASMHGLLLEHPPFNVSVLSAEQEAYSRRFADQEEPNPFDGVPFIRGENGLALIEGALAHLECHVIEHVNAGDHTIFLGAVDRAAPHEERPLLYYRGGYAQLER